MTQTTATRLTGEARREKALAMALAYVRDGKTIRALAEENGRSYGYIRQLLIDAKVPLRPRGGPRRRPLFDTLPRMLRELAA